MKPNILAATLILISTPVLAADYAHSPNRECIDCVIREADGAQIPPDPRNADYQKYLAAGGTLGPAVASMKLQSRVQKRDAASTPLAVPTPASPVEKQEPSGWWVKVRSYFGGEVQ